MFVNARRRIVTCMNQTGWIAQSIGAQVPNVLRKAASNVKKIDRGKIAYDEKFLVLGCVRHKKSRRLSFSQQIAGMQKTQIRFAFCALV